MAWSPREELRIIAITQFEYNLNDHLWYWHTDIGDIPGGVTGGMPDLTSAVQEFFAHQRFDQDAEHRPDVAHFSKLVRVGEEFHLREYAHGAPDPFDPAQPEAVATIGWVPPGVEE
jgi:hypothetical protein